MNPAVLPALARHLVESTAFAALAIALAALLRRTDAATRHAILLAAIAKFALPLSWFVAFGTGLRALLPHPTVAFLHTETVLLLPAAGQLTATHPAASILPHLLLTVWLAGVLPLFLVWLHRLLKPFPSRPNLDPADLLTLSRMQHRLGLRRAVLLRTSTAATAPHLRGILRPSILLPAHLSHQLTTPEFEAILLHELAHARRRDNLTRVLAHALTCVFWFHPLLWWLERRLNAEAEIACDELVLASGIPSETYLQGICKVCQLTLLRPIPGRSHVSGSNLTRRLERIMSLTHATPRNTTHANLAGALLLTATLALATAAGLLTSTPVQAQVQAQTPEVATGNAPIRCMYASKQFPQGTAIRPTHHPELLQVCGQENGQPRWFRTTEREVHDRSTPVVALDDTPDPQSLSCKVTAPDGNFCTCDHRRNSPGSVVGSPQGKLVCPASTGRWQPYQGNQTPYPPLPANPVPLAQ